MAVITTETEEYFVKQKIGWFPHGYIPPLFILYLYMLTANTEFLH